MIEQMCLPKDFSWGWSALSNVAEKIIRSSASTCHRLLHSWRPLGCVMTCNILSEWNDGFLTLSVPMRTVARWFGGWMYWFLCSTIVSLLLFSLLGNLTSHYCIRRKVGRQHVGPYYVSTPLSVAITRATPLAAAQPTRTQTRQGCVGPVHTHWPVLQNCWRPRQISPTVPPLPQQISRVVPSAQPGVQQPVCKERGELVG